MTVPGPAVREIPGACFVAGSGKSGTTLLMALLDGHPQILSFPEETAYFPTVVRKLGKRPREEQAAYLMDRAESRLLFEREKQHHGNRDYSDFPREEFRELFQKFSTDPARNSEDLLSVLMDAYATVLGHSREEFRCWIEKTPANRWCFPEIRKRYPTAKILLMLRDPRAITAAFLRRQKEKSDASFSFYLCVKHWMEAAKLAAKHMEDPLVRVLRFEDLVSDPEHQMAGVCAFLEVDFTEAATLPTKAGRPWSGNSTSKEKFTKVDSAPVSNWKTTLTLDEVEFVESFCGRLMEKFSYHCESEAAGKVTRYHLHRHESESRSAFFKDRRRMLADSVRGFWNPASPILH